MDDDCSMLENGTRKSTFTIANLDTSCSMRRSLLSGEDSPSNSGSHGKVSTSPQSVVTSERVFNRSKTGTILDSGTRFCKCYTGTVLLSLVGLVIVSVSAFSDWNVLLDCPLLAAREDPHRGMGSFELVGKSATSEEQTTGFETNQNSDERQEEYLDDKCWSRSRHLLYRPEDRRLPPAPALTRSLTDYERMHARCTAGKTWKTGTDLQRRNADSEDNCKYLIYVEGWEGLGNRILSLVSAFAFSLATNRVLLIDSRGHLQGLLCEPFHSSSWKLPAEFPYDKVRSFPGLENVEGHQNDVGINLNLRHQQSETDQTFFCPETQQRLSSVRWLAWNSNQYYIPRLLMIPSLWTELNPLFPSPPQAFSQLVRYLCLPSNPVWAKVERTYQAYLLSSQKLVGLQIRDQSQHSFSHTVYDKVLNCLVGAEILPNVSRHESAPPAFSLERKNRSHAGGGGTSIFVASLQRDYYQALRDLYLDHGTMDGRSVSVHTVANDGAEIHSYQQAVRAYIDIWLLSFSDTLVTSGWSTFGYMAQGLGGVAPYIINLKATSPPFCFFGQSIEPCNHYPFLSTCGTTTNLSKEHEGWVNQHLRHCQDERNIEDVDRLVIFQGIDLIPGCAAVVVNSPLTLDATTWTSMSADPASVITFSSSSGTVVSIRTSGSLSRCDSSVVGSSFSYCSTESSFISLLWLQWSRILLLTLFN